MTVIPLSLFELLSLILTVVLIYVTWQSGKNTKKKNKPPRQEWLIFSLIAI